MDCHRCIYLSHQGSRYGRCTHPGHLDVMLKKGQAGSKRPYNRQVCYEFKLRKRCSNCRHWVRGEYFSDGITPSRKGHCKLYAHCDGTACEEWKPGATSWKKRRES